jgi:hypothetical protein
MRYKIKSKADRQTAYMVAFAELLLAKYPRLAGHIDWDAAKYYYLYGTPVADAVDLYIIARNIT